MPPSKHSRPAAAESVATLPPPVTVAASPAFDWHAAPLPDVITRLADLRREYDRCAEIVLARQSTTRARWTCWTQLHRDDHSLVSASVARLCRKTGDDGKWASRDDGVFKIVDGIRIPDPVFCCSALCHEAYLKSKPLNALSRH